MYCVCICVFFLCRLIFCKKLFFFLSHRSSFSPFFFSFWCNRSVALLLSAVFVGNNSFIQKLWYETLKLFNAKPCKCSTWQPNQFLCLMNEIVKHARIHMMSSQNVIRYFGWSFLFCLRSKTLMNTISISTQSDVKCDELYMYIGVRVFLLFSVKHEKSMLVDCLLSVARTYYTQFKKSFEYLFYFPFINATKSFNFAFIPTHNKLLFYT